MKKAKSKSAQRAITITTEINVFCASVPNEIPCCVYYIAPHR